MGRPSSVTKVFQGLIALATIVAVPGGAAQAQDDAVAVLGVEAPDGVPATVATAITDAMRQKVSSTSGFRLVPGRDLVEVKLIFSCPDEAPSCMAEAAQSLGATKLIFGSVKKAPGGSFLVTLKLLDAATSKIESYIAEQLDRKQATDPGVRGPVQKWFGDLTGRSDTGTIRVSANIIGAAITLDGLSVGVTRDEPVELASIPAGDHEVVISKADHEPIKKQVTVEAGKVVEITGELASNQADVDTGTVASSRVAINSTDEGEQTGNRGLKFAAWSTAGASAISLILALKFGADVGSINDDLDPFRRFNCASSATGVCDSTGDPVAAGDIKLTPDEEVKVQSLRDDGDQAELLQYVFYGSTVVLLGASAYLFYAAYLDDGDEAESTASSRGARNRRIPVLTPYVLPGSAGLNAHWRF